MLHTAAAPVVAAVAAIAHEFYVGVLLMRCSRLWEKVLRVVNQASGPTSQDFGILPSIGRPHEPWRRPQNRPSPGDVGVGGHGSGQSKRKGRPRVETRTSERAEDSGFVCFVETQGVIIRTGSLICLPSISITEPQTVSMSSVKHIIYVLPPSFQQSNQNYTSHVFRYVSQRPSTN